MDVQSCPDVLPPPAVDYANYDPVKAADDEARHVAALVSHYRRSGHDGPNTGRLVRFPVGDGYAQYLLVDGRESFLVHLPYGDGYRYLDVAFLPKEEILRRMSNEERFAAQLAALRARPGEGPRCR